MGVEKEIDEMLCIMEKEDTITNNEYDLCKKKLNSYDGKMYKGFRERLSSLIKKLRYWEDLLILIELFGYE